ncbi:MAG: DUF4330 domain-containing protein [Candidatus Gastranaerophilales bacterium]|nr:DUF4330 domain-containing protein [Candidatus Gastranaerophilales bacterium]
MNFKEFKKTDWLIIGLVIAFIIIAVLAFVGKNTFLSKSPVNSEEQVAFQVFFRGITITDQDSPFKPNDETFITIRNVPYAKLKISDVKFDRRKIALPAPSTKEKVMIVDDVSSPFQFDFLVTLVDKAKITDDGAVVGGNKLKIGVPIILEGKNYKLNGTISNVQVLSQNQQVPQGAQGAPQANAPQPPAQGQRPMPPVQGQQPPMPVKR